MSFHCQNSNRHIDEKLNIFNPTWELFLLILMFRIYFRSLLHKLRNTLYNVYTSSWFQQSDRLRQKILQSVCRTSSQIYFSTIEYILGSLQPRQLTYFRTKLYGTIDRTKAALKVTAFYHLPQLGRTTGHSLNGMVQLAQVSCLRGSQTEFLAGVKWGLFSENIRSLLSKLASCVLVPSNVSFS